MTSFRRAQLRGSEELFRPTRPGESSDTAVATPPAPVSEAPATATAVHHEGRLVRLTDEEIALLSDALQRLKFPTSARPAVTKPSVAEFERLEELRQKLLG